MKRNGYTLTEILIAIGLIGAVAIVALPPMLQLHDVWALETAALEFTSTLERARVRAVLSNGSVKVSTSSSGYMLQDLGSAHTVLNLPGKMHFISPPIVITFGPRGTIAPGTTITLSHKTRTVAIMVSPAGRIRIVR